MEVSWGTWLVTSLSPVTEEVQMLPGRGDIISWISSISDGLAEDWRDLVIICPTLVTPPPTSSAKMGDSPLGEYLINNQGLPWGKNKSTSEFVQCWYLLCLKSGFAHFSLWTWEGFKKCKATSIGNSKIFFSLLMKRDIKVWAKKYFSGSDPNLQLFHYLIVSVECQIGSTILKYEHWHTSILAQVSSMLFRKLVTNSAPQLGIHYQV